MPKERIKDIGEKELLSRLSLFMPKKQIADDCASLIVKDNNLLINTDLMVENTHFQDEILAPKDIGWKLVATNISDLISSGCEEILGINIALVLPPSTEWEWVKNLYVGINDALNQFGGVILGGDCSKGESRMIALTAIGTQGEIQLRRYACKKNEIILTSGVHGLSKVGFLLKKNLIQKDFLSPELIKDSSLAFRRPEPKWGSLKSIINTRNDNDKTKIGGTDSSDGLYQAVLDLARESHCQAVIDYKKIPTKKYWPHGKKWDQYYLFGGEDYQLVFALPVEWAKRVMEKDKSIYEIGYFQEGKPKVKIKNNELIKDIEIYSHF